MNFLVNKHSILSLPLQFTIPILFLFLTSNIIGQSIHPYEDTARQYIGVGEFQKATLYLEKAQDVYVSQKEYEKQLMTYVGLSMCFQAQGKMNLVEKNIDLGLQVSEKYKLNKTPTFAYLLQLAGVLYEYKGEYANALWATQENINLLKELGEEGNKDNYNNMAAIYKQFADFDTALKYYHKALKLDKNNPIYLHNIGVIWEKKGDYKKAIDFFNRSLEATKNDNDRITTYVDLSNCYRLLGAYDRALSYAGDAKELISSPDINNEDVYRALALISVCLKEYKQAHNYIELALKEFPLGQKHPMLGKNYQVKAQIYVAQNQHQKALEHYDLALEQLVKNYDKNQAIQLDSVLSNPELLETLIGKAESRTALKHPKKEILELYTFAAELIDHMRINFITDGSKVHLVRKSIPIVYDAAIQLALETGDVSLAFELSEKNKAGVLLEQTQKKMALQYLNSSTKRTAGITFKTFQHKSPQNINEAPFKLSVLQKELAQNQALISYFVGQERTHAFLLDKQDIHSFSFKNIPEQDIQDLIISLKEKNFPCDSSRYTVLAYAMYQKLLKPILKLGNYERLVIVPDDLLSAIPLDALLTEASPNGECRFNQLSYVLNQYSIGYAYSARLWYLHKQNKRESKQLQLLAFAPSFSKKAQAFCNGKQTILQQLDNQTNIQSICSHRTSKSFLGQDANIANFKQYAEHYDIIHLATHACMDLDNFNRHRIFFADSPLLSSEIYDMNLQARLVVLSACETGLGYLQRGEGVMSLARAFSGAGCPSVLMSLWSVDDQSTKEIMLTFHENLAEGKPQDVALRDAKLTYLENKPNASMHPNRWAAFVQIGDADSLGRTTKITLFDYWWLGVALAGLAFFVLQRKSGN